MRLLDQRLLPAVEVVVDCEDARSVAEAIRDMVVRGAPAIGVAAAYGMAAQAVRGGDDERILFEALARAAHTLSGARPTAVNLRWAVERVLGRAEAMRDRGAAAMREAVVAEALALHEEDFEGNRRMGAYGEKLLPDGATVLTICNTGALATGGWGTALGVVRSAQEAGKRVRVLAMETRPYLQGARLTAWECRRYGLRCEVITDSMAGHFLKKGEITAAITGADRIAKNGDTANKIGTYGLAVLCDAHDVPFFVAAPRSTIDLRTSDGEGIPIEERDGREVTHIAGTAIVPEGVPVRNPAFDVTPARLIRAVITDQGIVEPPYAESLERVVAPPH